MSKAVTKRSGGGKGKVDIDDFDDFDDFDKWFFTLGDYDVF